MIDLYHAPLTAHQQVGLAGRTQLPYHPASAAPRSAGTLGMLRILHTRVVHYILLLTVTAALTLPGLGAISLWDIDEGLNAEAAREMLESGDWGVPTFNFKPRTSKPALLYWLQALAYQRFGVNEFSARLPSALAAAMAVLLTYELGRRMFTPGTGLLA